MTLDGAEAAGGRLTVDLSAIARNYQYLAGLAPTAETAAAVKAGAYGLGLKPVVTVLSNCGCRTFFVALPQEGAELRRIVPHAEIFVLAGLAPGNIDLFLRDNLTPVLNSLTDVALWAEAGPANAPFALHVDTGMNRLGLAVEDLASVSQLKPRMVLSHFACADEPDHPLNNQQLAAFREVQILFPDAVASLANSAGILNGSDCHFDLTRPGIALYGGGAISSASNPMLPVVKLEGQIVQIRHIKQGRSIGYGATHKFSNNARVAIVAVGYADGYLRAASGSGTPLRPSSKGGYGKIKDTRVPVVGRISMDLTAFDITAFPDNAVCQGEWITLLDNEITVDDLAQCAGTIGYEILTSLGRRYARTYING